MARTRRQHPKRRAINAVLGLYLASWFPITSAIWPFPPKRFTGNALIDAGSLGIDSRVIAFGDFNGDQYLDVLCLDSDQQTLSIYLWTHDLFHYTSSASFRHPTKVVNIVPGDFTHDGRLDLLVMGQGASNELDLLVYPALPSGGFDFSHPINIPSSSSAQPITADVDGDMKIDLLGMTPASQSDPQVPLQVWKNVWNISQSNSPLFEIVSPEFHGSQCRIADPHGNAVIDLNGDCLADVFLVCDNGRAGKSFQIWINNKDSGFDLTQQGSLPSDIQSISFADIDRDGTIDLVFTTCSFVSSSTGIGSDCYINIAYNQQLPLCTKPGDSGIQNGVRSCRPPDDLCIGDPNFKFDFSDNEAFVRFPVSTLFSSGASSPPSLLVRDLSFSPPLPLPIKLGDANLDGFPDFLMIIASGNDRTPYLAFSVPCAKGVAGCRADGTGRRGWAIAQKGAEVLGAIKDARSVSFLDMDEDGSLDILVQRSGSAGQGMTMFVQNNFYYDAFFLKAIVLNGACDNGWCYSANRSEKYHPFGISYSGASYKYTVLDTSGHRSAAQVGQLPQTSYHALYTPYSFFGLGRTNNYIENLFIGSTIHAEDHYINLEGVIPNSKLVIIPTTREEAWKRQLFLRPGEWIPWVTVTVVSGTALLAIIVFVLHLNEKREDELERRRASHHINFDAL
ncbi:hypothetical protein BDN72DRAFT_780663 [Pluteus cervinus]|uniref:Uncharacterized protein n=1 Tax=Pluteus cervinus TaxID=181527 RepID=A0ACD3A257_9AGAR|nr:hypothetical protein BDN72DRAFT_780663 [Pluteus cervinus]